MSAVYGRKLAPERHCFSPIWIGRKSCFRSQGSVRMGDNGEVSRSDEGLIRHVERDLEGRVQKAAPHFTVQVLWLAPFAARSISSGQD